MAILAVFCEVEAEYFSVTSALGSRWFHWIFQWHISFRQYHEPGVDSAPSENEYQEHSWG